MLEQEITCEVMQQPKLVQITTNQSNYQLDTSYNYVSLLVVGGGNDGEGYDSNVRLAGGSGLVSYWKNIPVTKFSNDLIIRFNERFSEPTSESLDYTRCTTFGNSRGDYYVVALGGMGLISGYNEQSEGCSAMYALTWTTVSNFSQYFVNAGSSGGGDKNKRIGYSGFVSVSGGGSSHRGSIWNGSTVSGGAGGDGTYGYSGGSSGSKSNTNIIPLQSIFEGTGKGGSAGSNASQTEFYSGGGGGYGNGDYPNPRGYGGGGAANEGGSGIVCIYYHDTPL